MRAVLLVCLFGAAPAWGQGLGARTADPKLQAFADLGNDARYDAWKELVKAGRSSVPTFVALLAEKHNALRSLGGSGLAQLGPLAADAVPALHAIVKDGAVSGPFRLVVIAALGNIGPDAAAAAPELRRLLASDERIERITSAIALAKIDPTAQGLPEAVAGMIGVGRMESPHAITVAGIIGPRAAGCRGALVAVARQAPDRFQRRDALRALAAIDGGSDATRALLADMLADEEPLVALEAAALLGGTEATAAAILAKGLESAVPVARVTAAAAVLRVEPACVNGTLAMMRALDGSDAAATLEALYQLRRSGRGAQAFAEEVAQLGAASDVPRVAGEAALTLWAITGDRARTLAIARRALERGYFDRCADVVRLARSLKTTK